MPNEIDSIQTAGQPRPAQAMNVPRKYRVAAVLWLILPGALLMLVIISYLAAAIFSQSADSSPVLSLLKTSLGLLGVLSIIAIFISIPMAAYIGSLRKEPVAQFDQRSGRGDRSDFPPELKKWNWGAAGLSMIWGVYHGVWWCFFSMIPYVNWIWWIVMGLEGNKWAWGKRYWASVEEFKAAQNKWKIWGMVFLFLPLALSVFLVLLSFAVNLSH
ncbi:MAG: hypothetical protein ACOZBH_02905 [Patescibacteria group bacterium]